MDLELQNLGFRVWGLGLGLWSSEVRVERFGVSGSKFNGLGFQALGFRASGLGL